MKLKLVLVTISLILIVIPFWVKEYQIVRLSLAIIGLLLLTFSLFLNKKKNIFKIAVVFISFFGELFLIDYLLVSFSGMPPILAIKRESSKDVINYNAIFYRTYNCQGNQTIDHFYSQVYACNVILDEISINTISSEVLNNYSKYNQKFFNIQGKISKIEGNNILELQGYETTDNNLNGHVLFHNHVTIQVDLGNRYDLSNYKIYDTINVIGKISFRKKTDSTTYIYLRDAILLETDLYKTYTLNFTSSKTCSNDLKLISKTNEYNFYSNCLNDLFVNYDENNIYELSYVLTDHRMTLEKLIENAKVTEENDMTLYENEKYNVLKCSTNNVILGNKKLDLSSKLCEQFVEVNTDENNGR